MLSTLDQLPFLRRRSTQLATDSPDQEIGFIDPAILFVPEARSVGICVAVRTSFTKRLFSLQSRAEIPSDQASDQKPVSVLVVEDNPADAGLIRKALEEHGVEGVVTHIIDGETAIAFIEAVDADQLDCPDLAIIDLNLPKRPGQDVLERMRQSAKCREIPVVILSSSDAKRDVVDAERLRASQYIRKPTRLEEFLRLGTVFKDALDRSSQ